MPIGEEETPTNGKVALSQYESSLEEKSNAPGRLLDENQRLDPQKLFELVSQNYDSWLQVLNKQFNDDENFLPFPQQSAELKPIFDYSLLDALDQASPELSENLKRLEQKIPKKTKKPARKQKNNEMDKNKLEFNPESLLKKSEMEFLRNKISELVMRKGFGINHEPKQEGFSLYDTRDEEGLHEGNSQQYDDQGDYDLEEIDEGESFLYSVSPGEHGLQIMKNDDDFHYQDEDDNEPSCEFTFEYDANGKLIHTDNNIEEKLRMMNLHPQLQKDIKLPSISELNIEQPVVTKSKKKKKKKSKREDKRAPDNSVYSCLFCEYEDFYGEKPREMIKWYNQKVKKDEERRLEIKRKLENAKLRAMNRQRDIRHQKLDEEPEDGHDTEGEGYRLEKEVSPPNYSNSVS